MGTTEDKEGPEMELYGYNLAIEATRRHALSARPHAPVVPEPETRPSTVRIATAAMLRRLADRVQPPPAYQSG